MRIQEFSSGGIQAQLTEKNSANVCFLFFLVLNLFYSCFTEGVQWFILRKTIFMVPEGVQHFPGGGGGGGGVQMLISIETYRTCDFPGGSGPLSPLWIYAWLDRPF